MLSKSLKLLNYLKFAFVFGALASCGLEQEQLPSSEAKNYAILSIDDTSFLQRQRLKVFITAPTAHRFEERAQTALKAAVDVQQDHGVAAVSVFLEVSPLLAGNGYPIAIANYAPDGGGWTGEKPFRNISWEAEATEHALTDKEIQIGEKWHLHESDFQVADGSGGKMTDEDALKSYIAEMLDISPADVSLLPLLEIITSRQAYDGSSSNP